MAEYRITAEQTDAELRVDAFLAEQFEELTRSYIKKQCDAGALNINGKKAKASQKLSEGDEIILTCPDPIALEVEAEDIPLDIVYEDQELLVINKPRGMVVHPAAGNQNGTLVNALLHHCPGELSGINGVIRPGIVHRIDKDTSGLLVVAKTNGAHLSLAEQLREHSMTRRYRAIVWGKTEEGTIDAPIGRHPVDRKKMAIVPDGRRAVTHYKTLRQFSKWSLVECQLETGRTHQIRVHLSANGHPLVGDSLYGGKRDSYGLEGQALHAGVLGFVHPVSKEYMEFSVEPPEAFTALLEKIEKIG